MLKQKALEIRDEVVRVRELRAKDQDVMDELDRLRKFAASDRYIASWKERHNLASARVCGESESISNDDVKDTQNTLQLRLEDYALKDIFN